MITPRQRQLALYQAHTLDWPDLPVQARRGFFHADSRFYRPTHGRKSLNISVQNTCIVFSYCFNTTTTARIDGIWAIEMPKREAFVRNRALKRLHITISRYNNQYWSTKIQIVLASFSQNITPKPGPGTLLEYPPTTACAHTCWQKYTGWGWFLSLGWWASPLCPVLQALRSCCVHELLIMWSHDVKCLALFVRSKTWTWFTFIDLRAQCWLWKAWHNNITTERTAFLNRQEELFIAIY